MRTKLISFLGQCSITALLVFPLTATPVSEDRDPHKFKIHDPNRPVPPKVNPGPPGPPAPAPSDAIVLFDGKDLSKWQSGGGAPAKWNVTDDGAIQVVPGAGDIQTRETWGDAQLHIEFKTDPQSTRKGQSRSNSGVFFGNYEVQVLDNYENKTYADGLAGSLYGQYPPLVDASRPPGEWQSFDIIYIRPRFDNNGKVVSPAVFTVFHNGVLVQHAEELVGPTSHAQRAEYRPHGRLPLRLQDHRDDPIEFRNIWIRDLE
jgi:hypothetical protein